MAAADGLRKFFTVLAAERTGCSRKAPWCWTLLATFMVRPKLGERAAAWSSNSPTTQMVPGPRASCIRLQVEAMDQNQSPDSSSTRQEISMALLRRAVAAGGESSVAGRASGQRPTPTGREDGKSPTTLRYP